MVFSATFNNDISVFRGGQFYWWRKQEYLEKTTDLPFGRWNLICWLFKLSVLLNLDNESNFLIAMSSLFHSFTVEGINDELVIESLQRGINKWSPIRKVYMVVLWIVGGTRWREYSGATSLVMLKNNLSFLCWFRFYNVTQLVSPYKYGQIL